MTADQLENRNRIEQQRLAIAGDSIKAQLAGMQAQVEQKRVLARLRRDQVKALAVRAGIGGMLQQVPVEYGQRVSPGTILAKVAEQNKLKAVLQEKPPPSLRSVYSRQGVTESIVNTSFPDLRRGNWIATSAISAAAGPGA